jgi:1,4-alpha-glucan branching enzyme
MAGKAATNRRKKATASKIPGMGAIIHKGGVSFRVWAPHANEVFVAGNFNDWSKDANPLASEKNGYWSVNVAEAKAGDHYKFRIVNGDLDMWRIDPYAREVTNSVGEGVITNIDFAWDTDDYRSPAWHEMVIYEMHVGTFNAKDGKLGTFDTAIERLPYLRDLGINVVEVMPPMEFPGGISWGYNPSQIYAVESDYGGPDAFKRFIKAAHEHGIAVILDVVYNHFGPSDLSLWQFDGWSENGMGGIYFYNDWKANTPWGDTRPDYGRPEVRQYIRDNALMWLEEYHVDGLRFDMTAYIRNVKASGNPDEDLPDGWSLLQWINSEVEARQPWKLMIAEDLQGSPALTAPAEAGGAGFDSQWDSQFVHPIREAIITMDDAHRDMGKVAQAIAFRYSDDAFERLIYTESHDEVANGKARVPEEIKPGEADSYWSKKRSTLGGALVFTTPGIPMIFQGQEFLEDTWFSDTDPLDWGKLERHGGIHLLYTDLMRLRRNWQGNTRGLQGHHVQVHHCNEATKIIAFHRFAEGGPGDSVIVVANFSGEYRGSYEIGLPAPGLWRVRFNSDWQGYDPAFHNTPTFDLEAHGEGQDGMPCRGSLDIGPYAVVILSQDRD